MNGFVDLLGGSLSRAPWGWAMFAVILATIIKGWPAIVRAASDAKAARVGEKQIEDHGLLARVVELERKVEEATTSAHNAELKLVSALAAYRLIASELLKLDPGNRILKQAQELLNVSYPTPRQFQAADSIREGASA